MNTINSSFILLIKLEHIFLVIRVITLLLCIIGIVLYGYWWIKVGKVSWLYKYIILLFTGESIVQGIDLYITYQLHMYNKLSVIEQVIYLNRIDLRFIFFCLIIFSSFKKFYKASKES